MQPSDADEKALSGPARWAARWVALEPHIDLLLGMPDDARARWLAQHEVTHADEAAQLRELLQARDAASSASFLAGTAAPPAVGSGEAVGDVLGAYTLVAPIGEGGMGTVWRARRSDGRYEGQVAIKLLHQGLFDNAAQVRFQREGAILARLRHPGIAQLLDAGLTPRGQPFLVLELIDGETIARWCDRHRLGIRERLERFGEVLDAVAAAHAQLVIHRDLKPSNILVNAEGHVKLLDFGIARLLGDAPEACLTRAGAIALTPAYAAPEQFESGALTLATDVYALGVVLHELLTGVHPSGAGSATSAIHYLRAASAGMDVRASDRATQDLPNSSAAERAQCRGESPLGLRRHLRGDLDNVLARALAPLASKRYGTVPEFAADLRRHLNHEPVSAHEAGRWYRSAKFVRRHRLAVGLSTGVLLSLCIGLAATLWQARQATRARIQAEAERARAERMLTRRDAANSFANLLLTQVGQAGHPMSFNEIIENGEKLANLEDGADAATHAYVLITLAGYDQTAGNFEKARKLAEQARALARQAGDLPLTAMAQCLLGVDIAGLGDGAAGDALVAEAIPLASGDPDALATCWQQRGYMAKTLYDGPHMLEYAQRALDALHSLRSAPVRLALLQSDVADAYRVLGRYADAEAGYRQALQMLRDAGALESIEASTVFNNWGLEARDSGQPLQALERYRHAMRIEASIVGADQVLPTALVNTARLLIDMRQLDEAWSLADQGLRRATAGSDTQGVFYASVAESSIRRLQMRYAEADGLLRAAQRQLDALRPAPKRMALRLAFERAQLEDAQGRPETALAQLDALRAAMPPHPPGARPDPVEQTVLQARAEALAALGRSDAAIADARASLALARALQRDAPSSATTGAALLTLARLQLAAGAHDDAIASAREAAKQLGEAAGPQHPDAIAAAALASR